MTRFLLTLLCLPFACAAAAPNIVFILADDLGRECLACYGGQSYPTPNLDRLAEEGTRFEACYATPMCSPTRVMLMTGRYNFRNYTQWARMDFSEATLGKAMRRAGYDTAVFGKWHLGGWDAKPYGPTRAGFDRYAVFDYEKVVREGGQIGNQFWKTEVWEDDRNFRLEGYAPAFYRRHALDFIRSHAKSGSKPFFLYYPLVHAHRPFVPTDTIASSDNERTVRNGELKNFPAMVAHIDATVGEVLKTLEATDQLKNTVVFFSADNGTDNVAEAKGLRSRYRDLDIPGGKYLPTEMGANVPLLVRGPDIPAGRVLTAPVDFTDILPTLCAIGAERPPFKHDGQSLWPLLKGGPESGHDGVAFTWGVYEHSSKKYKTPGRYREELIHIVRDRRWKLLSTGGLYDLQSDWQEESPFTGSVHADVRARLEGRLRAIRQGAVIW